MDSRALIALLRHDLQAAAKDRTTGLNWGDLDAYLATVDGLLAENDPTLDQFSAERTKAANELQRTQYQHQLDHHREAAIELFKSVITSGQAAMQSALLVNGAAATALLAFAGHLLSVPGGAAQVRSAGTPLTLFVFGVGFAAVAFGVTYLTNHLASDGRTAISTRTNNVAIAFVVLSYSVFFVAAFKTGQIVCSL